MQIACPKCSSILEFPSPYIHDGVCPRCGTQIRIRKSKVYEQSETYGHSFFRELAFLTVHGLLHLLGYDHMELEDEKEMFSRQELILNEAGITK